jgi:hypothetical protein
LGVQSDERLTGFESELGGKHSASSPKCIKRFSLSPGSIQRHHELSPGPFLEGMGRYQRFELGHQLTSRTGRQIGIDAQHQRL